MQKIAVFLLKIVAFLLLIAGGSSGLAARRVTVEQLEQLIAGARDKPDAKMAQELSDLELTERLSTAKLSRLDSVLPGPQSRRSLVILADMSAFRSLPAAEIPANAPPDLASQRKMMAQTIQYAEKTVSSLPNFFATRETARFENSPQGHLAGTSLIPYQSLHAVGTSTVSVLYRDGREVIDAGAVKNKKAESTPQGLSTRGVFGPILGTVLVDAAQGKLGWSHWEHGARGPVAVFRYSIPKEKSHYQVEFCCVRGANPSGLFQQFSGYHGYLAIDPATGAILRLTIEAEPKPSDPILRSDAAVEYGPVEIGGNTYICPAKSVSILVSPPIDRYGFVTASNDGSFIDKEGQTAPESVQIWLNDAVFENYHVFHADTRLVAASDESSAEPQSASGDKSTASPNAGLAPSGPPVSTIGAETSPVAEAPVAAPPSASAEKMVAAASAAAPATRPAAVGLPASEITVTAATELPDTPTQPSPDAAFSLRVNARLVDIGVVAYDKKGHPLTGLKAEDFEIYDNGRKQTVRFFSQTGDPSAAPPANEPGSSPQPAYSNRPAAPAPGSTSGSTEGAATILLIDAGNLPWPNLTNARTQMLRFLQGLPAGERVGLYVLQAHSFQVLEETTNDRPSLVAKLSQWMPSAQDLARSRETEERNRQQFDEVRSSADLQSVNGNLNSSPDTASTVDPKLLANGSNPLRDVVPVLVDVARHLAAVPGHKSLVWVSSDNVLANWTDKAVGRDKGGDHTSGMVLHAQEALNDAHVSIYPLDASQLETAAVEAGLENMNVTLAPGTMAGPAAQGGADKTGRITAQMQQDAHGIQPAVQDLATGTGGRIFRRSGDFVAELNQAVADGRATYLLSFTPGTPADDQYHQLTVKLPTRRGVTLRYRTGYQYTKEPVTLKDRIREAISQPLDVHDIAVSASPVETPLGATLKLKIATNDLSLKLQDDRWVDKLDIFLVQREDVASHARVSGQTIGLKLLPATYREAVKSGVPFDQLVAREQDTGSIRIVVIDESSGRIGSVTVPATAMQGKWH
jgi:VWFA-related protein